MRKRIISMMLVICMVLMYVPITAFAENVTDTVTTWGTNGSISEYNVHGNVTIGTPECTQNVTVNGSVNLNLTDGCNLTINGNIEGGSLTIKGTGTLDVKGSITGGYGQAGIGGGGGDITIEGGVVKAGSISGGIGGSGYVAEEGGNNHINNGGDGGNIIIKGGVIEAESITGGTGGGSTNGTSGSGGNITISGGVVKAESISGGKGGNEGSCGGTGGSVKITGGVVEGQSISGGSGGGSFNGGGCSSSFSLRLISSN